MEQTRIHAVELLSAALATGPEAAIEAAMSFKPVGARGLRVLFNFLEECLSDLAKAASRLPPDSGESDEDIIFHQAVERWGIHPATVPAAMERVDDARTLAAGNVNPQLLIFGLLHDLRRELANRDRIDHRKT
jgi:hypothetical protein